jgi:hypothetical protein
VVLESSYAFKESERVLRTSDLSRCLVSAMDGRSPRGDCDCALPMYINYEVDIMRFWITLLGGVRLTCSRLRLCSGASIPVSLTRKS